MVEAKIVGIDQPRWVPFSSLHIRVKSKTWVTIVPSNAPEDANSYSDLQGKLPSNKYFTICIIDWKLEPYQGLVRVHVHFLAQKEEKTHCRAAVFLQDMKEWLWFDCVG